jgi:inosine-uridine nucleoside N-ribohydrolase
MMQITDIERLRLLEPPQGPVRIVLDTDTANEIDDQFALAYALLSPERITLEAIYAAPFGNDRSNGPADGMERSYDEIMRVLARMDRSGDGLVFKGSTAWLPAAEEPVQSAAADDLVQRASAAHADPLYVVAIGAITNVASALLQAPQIAPNIVVVWLGGNPSYWPRATEFNVEQDMHAARVIFDSGVPLVHVPCINVTEHLRTTQAEMERFVHGRGAIGDYLFEIFSGYRDDHFARSKEIWDLGALAYLVDPTWFDGVLIHSPILTDDRRWSSDPHRHLIRELRSLQRDAIFADLFHKLAHAAIPRTV